METFTTGAKRSVRALRFDLIPKAFLEHLAHRYEIGAKKYGEYNWQKGLPTSDVLNHMTAHLLSVTERLAGIEIYTQHNEEDANVCSELAAIAWGCATLIYFETQRTLRNATLTQTGVFDGHTFHDLPPEGQSVGTLDPKPDR